ncbi:MAG: GTP-binding protein [Thermoplasmata archaeon]|nr:GTP-binding protein [Thermoplasmata archaeon]
MRVLTKKVALLGDWATGKTSLIRRFVLNMFDDSYIQTIGTKVSKKTVKFYDQDEPVVVNLLIWDLLGQKEYHRIHREAYRGVDGAILVCDLTRKETLGSLAQYWYPSLIDVAGKVPVIVAGNKADLKDNLVLGIEEIKRETRDLGLSDGMCYLTSAKTGQNVEQVFHLMAECTAMLDETIELMEELGRIAACPETNAALNTIEDVADYLIVDFVRGIGNTDRGMDLVRMGFRECGLTLKNLRKEKLNLLVDFLYKKEIECGIAEETASANRKRREQLIAGLKG